jgi:hypothetical protein
MSRLMKGAKSIGAWHVFKSTAAACERCVFGRGVHMKGCPAKDRPEARKFVPSAATVKKGDRVLLTTMARKWTRGLIFEVDEVHAWGIVGRLAAPHPQALANYYGCPWSEVAEVIPPGKARRVNLGKLS